MRIHSVVAGISAMSLLTRAMPVHFTQTDLQNKTDTIFQAALAGSFAGMSSILDLYRTWNWCYNTEAGHTFQDRDDMPFLNASLCQVWTHNTTLILASKMMSLQSTKDMLQRPCESKMCAKEAAKIAKDSMALGLFIGLPVLSAGNHTLNDSTTAELYHTAVLYTIKTLVFSNISDAGEASLDDLDFGNLTDIDSGNGTVTHLIMRRGFRSLTGRFLARTRVIARSLVGELKGMLRDNLRWMDWRVDKPSFGAGPGNWPGASFEESTPDRIAESGPAREAYVADSERARIAAGERAALHTRVLRRSQLKEDIRRAYKSKSQLSKMSPEQRRAYSNKMGRLFRNYKFAQLNIVQDGDSVLSFDDSSSEGSSESSSKGSSEDLSKGAPESLFKGSPESLIGRQTDFKNIPEGDLDTTARNWQYATTLTQETSIAAEDLGRLDCPHCGPPRFVAMKEDMAVRHRISSFDPRTAGSVGQYFQPYYEEVLEWPTSLINDGYTYDLWRVRNDLDEWLGARQEGDYVLRDDFQQWLDDYEESEGSRSSGASMSTGESEASGDTKASGDSKASGESGETGDTKATGDAGASGDAEASSELPQALRDGEIPEVGEPEQFKLLDDSVEVFSETADGIDDIYDAANYDIKGVVEGKYDSSLTEDGEPSSGSEISYGEGKSGKSGKGGRNGAKGKGKIKFKGGNGRAAAVLDEEVGSLGSRLASLAGEAAMKNIGIALEGLSKAF